MSKRLGLLIVMMLFVSLMTGCFGSDDDSTSTTPATAASVVITGSIPALSAPAGAPNYMVAYGTNYEMGVFNAATMTEITGSAVVISGTTYTATVPAGAAVTALVVIRHKATGKVVFSALAGILPTSTAMSAGSVAKVTVSGVNLTGESTAIATLAKDKGIVAPSVPVSSTVTTMSASVKTAIDSAVGTATLTAITNAVSAVQAVLNNAGVSEATKTSILAAVDSALAGVLNAFVAAVKDASAVVNTTIGATTVSVGGQTISATSTTTDVTSAVNGVTVVTITAVSNPADITVASGTAVTAITFPTTVSVTKSNGTTATASVVWSTTSVPAYVATTSGTYVFTGTVSGTTLTAKVNVIVGAAAQTVATPTFSPAEGTYTAAQSVTISCATTGASIYYTTDGTTPTTASTAYTTAINVAATTTIKAIAVKTGMTNSAVASALYTMNISLIPVISAERAVKQANGDVVVTWTTNIVTPTAAKVIIRGSVPTPSDPSATETASTTTSHTVTVPAASFPTSYDKLVISYIIGEDGTSKEILKAAIVDAASVVADPVITPAAGTYTSAQSVTITCATTGASIYYTVDGTTPTSASTLYTAAFNVSASATVKAIATKATMTDSNVISAAYVINISTTKVLTGIALAKATDTVEANVAYTLPVVTASYDDTTSATVTASWAKGATAVTGTSVTETAAGTFTYTATYVENGVTKTADFTLVVTEAVPVKTLDSITVTPATLTDMLVNGTQAVALKVVANFLTGTVASTEEVTTTATVTASAGSYAAGVYTAGATAGAATLTVSYTSGTVTKTGTITVTVTAEAPRVDTMEVTFATTLAETSQTAAVVVVKDQFGAVMTTGFTTTYAITTGNSTVTTAGLVTGGAYDSSTTTNNNHVLTVTVTPTTGTAISKTAAFTVTGDTTKPTITSVVAVNNKTFVVTFSKKVSDAAVTMDATLDNTVPTYTLYGASQTATLQTGAGPASGYAQVTAAFVDSTKTSIKFVLVATHTDQQTGLFPMGLMTDIAYKFYASDVKDTAATPNTIIKLSNSSFTGSTLPDSAAPAIATATYDTGLGKLSLTFDKAIDAASNSGAKYSIVNGATTVTLTGVTGTISGNAMDFSLTEAQKTSLGTLATGATVSIAISGVTDGTNANTAVLTKEITATVRPTLLSASYSELTNVITLGFSEPIKLADITRTGFTFNYLVSSTSTDLVVGAANMVITTTGTTAQTVEVKLDQTGINAMNAQRANVNVTSYTVKMADSSIKDADGYANQTAGAVGQTVTMTYTKDSAVPTITGVSYTTNDNKLVVTYSKVMNVTVDAKANMVLKTKDSVGTALATIDASLDNGIATAGTWATDGKSITFVLDATEGPKFETALAYGRFLTVATGHGLKDVNANALADITTAAAAISVTYTDDTTASNVVASSISGKVVYVNLKDASNVEMLPASTNAAGTFRVIDANNQAVTYTPTWAQMLDLNNDGVKEQLALGFTTALANTSTYKVSYTGLKTAGGVAVTDGTTATAFSITTDSTAPLLTTTNPAVFEDVDASKSVTAGDKLTLTFGEPINVPTTGNTLADDMYGTSAARATFVEGSAKNIVVVTLGTSPTLKLDGSGQTGTTITNPSNVIVDFNAVAWTGVAQSIEVPFPTGATAPVQTGNMYYTDVDNNAVLSAGDRLTIPFDVKLDSTLDVLETNFTVLDGAGGALAAGTLFNASISSNEVILTFSVVDAADALPCTSASTVAITGSGSLIKSSWGLETAGLTAKATTPQSTVGPKPTAAAYNTATKQLKVTFDKAVSLTASGVAIDSTKFFSVVNGTLTAVTDANPGAGLWYDAADTTYKTVIFSCAADTGIEAGYTTINVRVGGATINIVRDFYGNKALRNSTADLAITAIGTGITPASPVVTAVGINNGTGLISVGATAMTSVTGNTRIHVYSDDDGTVDAVNTKYVASTTAADHTGTATTFAMATTWTPLAGGAYVGYVVEDASGNQSALVFDGIINTAAPVITAGTGAITANLGTKANTAGYINKALRDAASNLKINAANTAGGNIAGKVYFKIADAHGHSYTTGGDAIAAGAVAADIGTFVDGTLNTLTDGDALSITAWIVPTDATTANGTAITAANTACKLDITVPTFTAQLTANDGTTRRGDAVDAVATDKLVLTFSENVLAGSIDTTANTGINADFLIKTAARAVTIVGAAADAAAAFTNTVAVAANKVTITLAGVPTTALNVPQNSASTTTNADADAVISCVATQVTDAAGNAVDTTVVPIK